MCGGGGTPRPDGGGGGTPGGGGGGAPGGGGGSSVPPGSPTAPCPTHYCCGTTQWIEATGYCGDLVMLEGTITGNPPDGTATVEVLHPTNGSVVDSWVSVMNGGHFIAVWTVKAQTANWRTDRIRFRFTAHGITCTSSNVFTFRQRPTTNWVKLDRDMPAPNGGYAPPVELHDARLESNRVHYSLKLRLTGAGLSAPRQANAKSLIETAWNNGFAARNFHRTNCRRGRACDCAFD
ncbi:MAG: hypothetical protein ACRD68_14745, partial [Pyrinomonadaceae bacterium]